MNLLKNCSNCLSERIPEGGVHTAPERWVCASCWKKKTASIARKQRTKEIVAVSDK